MGRIRELSRPLEPSPTGAEARLRHLPELRAVLFDVYGTLFISAPCAAAGRDGPLAAAFAALQLPLPEPAAEEADRLLPAIIRERHEAARARGVEQPEIDIRSVCQELLRRLGAKTGIRLPCDRRTAERLALEQELRRNHVWPMPGAAETLDGLRRRGLQLGIVSNSQFLTPWLFASLLGAPLTALGFREPLCAWSYRCGCAKPSPALFRSPLRALARRGIPPASVLMVGNDHLSDVLPASRLGCRTALFAGDSRSYRPAPGDAPGDRPPPDLLLTRLPQLLEALPT